MPMRTMPVVVAMRLDKVALGGGPSGDGGASAGGAFLQCTGDTQTIPAGSGLGLTKESATTKLQERWTISLLPIQESVFMPLTSECKVRRPFRPVLC